MDQQEPYGTTGRDERAGVAATAVLAAAVDRQQAMTRFLRALVSIETPSVEPSTIEAAFDLLREGLEAAGMHCRRRSGSETAGFLLARPRRAGREELQLLLGHCDTVWPVGTLEQMPIRITDGRMHGPGVYDMKAGLTHTVFALRLLHDLGLEPQVAPVVLINADEEIGSKESERFIRRLACMANRTLVMEPSLTPSGKLKTARKGVAQYHILVKGRAAHAGLNPEQGVSAILELSILVQRLFGLNDPDRGISVNVGTIEGGLRPNVIAPESSAWVDVRAPTREDARRIDAVIRNLRPSNPEVQVEIQAAVARQPMEPTAASHSLWLAARRLAEELGFEIQEGMAGGGSDGNITCTLSPTLDGLGAVGDGAHAAHEYVDLNQMAQRTALLALLIMEPPLDPSPPTPTAGDTGSGSSRAFPPVHPTPC